MLGQCCIGIIHAMLHRLQHVHHEAIHSLISRRRPINPQTWKTYQRWPRCRFSTGDEASPFCSFV
jgi:hypothetical protein